MKRERSYQLGESRLILRFGDITSSDAQVIVSSDDSYISMGGGVSAAIRRAGGEAIALDASKKVPAVLGDVVVTTAGALSAQYVFHAITIGSKEQQVAPRVVVERTTRRCMQLLEELKLSSIAFPAVGAGVARFSYQDVAAAMAEVISDSVRTYGRPIDVTIYLFDRFQRMSEIDFVGFFEEFAARAPSLVRYDSLSSASEKPTVPSLLEIVAETEEEFKRLRLHNLRRLLRELEDHRGRLEQRLISLLGTDDSAAEGKVRQALKENQELRLQYLAELQAFSADGANSSAVSARPSPVTFFVSSTYRDLREHRAAVKDAIAKCDLFFRGMEHFGASQMTPASLVTEEVRKAEAYIGILGVRYGSIDDATGLSMTELEFREAESNGKPMLLYVLHPEASVVAAEIESDPDGQRKLQALKEHILKRYTPYLFKNADDLAGRVYADLKKFGNC